jgi:DNA-binding SARP family transcriptional activator
VEFGLLGRLVVRREGLAVPVPSGRQRVILAALLLRAGQVVSIDELIDLSWGGSPPRTARVTLYNHVRRLRHLLAEVGQNPVETMGSGYCIDAMAAVVDVTEFRNLIARGRAAAAMADSATASARLADALALWRGQPLADVPCPQLADAEIPALTELRAAALEERIDADLRLGRHREVLPELQWMARAEPLREQVQAMLMLALARSGRQGDALAAYQAARTALVTQLGIEPGSALRQAQQLILRGDAIPAHAATTR